MNITLRIVIFMSMIGSLLAFRVNARAWSRCCVAASREVQRSRTLSTLTSNGPPAPKQQAVASLKRGQGVKVKILQFGPLGASVQIAHDLKGLVLQQELAIFRDKRNGEEVQVGEEIDGYVERIREGGKVDISLRPVDQSRIEQCKEQVLTALKSAPEGLIPVGDKSHPDEITAHFRGMSKSDFKHAVGSLYKEGLIVPDRHSTKLVTQADLHAAQTAAAKANNERRKLRGGDYVHQNSTNMAATSSPDMEFIERDNDCCVFIGNLPPTIDYKGLVSAVHAVILPENIVKIKLCKDQEGIPRGFGYVQLAHADLVDQAIAILKGHEVKGRKLRADYADREKRFRQSARAEQWEASQTAHDDGEFDSDEEGYAAERRRARRGAGPVGLPQRGKVGMLGTGDGPGGNAGMAVTPWNRQAAAADGGAGEFRWGFRSAPRSSSSRLNPSRPLPEATLFVGNLAFDVTDAMLTREIEKFVGPDQVASVRVICDRSTGYSKGYAFVDVFSTATAEKIYNQMHEHEISGRRINIDDATK